MELTYDEEKLETPEEIGAIVHGSDRAWHFLALGLAAAIVGMLMVVVTDLLMRASY